MKWNAHMISRPTCIALLILAGLTAPVLALTPEEVLVVANANVEASVELATYYAQKRGIPDENIVLINTTADYGVSREDYDEQILTPIRNFMAQRAYDSPIRCICLMWGVPVRVENIARIPPKETLNVYKTQATRGRQILAMDREYLVRVGRTFTEPEVNNIHPLAKVFGPPAPALPRSLPALKKLTDNIELEWNLALELVAGIKDADKLRIAEQQLLALQFEMRGLEGLIEFIDSYKPALIPSSATYVQHLASTRAKLDTLEYNPFKQTPDQARALLEWVRRAKGTFGMASFAAAQAKRLNPGRSIKADASVDSELAMIQVKDYQADGALVNALHYAASSRPNMTLPPVIMACRIDGPTAEDARRIIDDSVAVEQTGLQGNVYVDAGMPNRFKNDTQGGYAAYDTKLRIVAELLSDKVGLPTRLDIEPEVFRPDTCPEAALYVGWYSLKSYVPAFQFVPGAVGWHVASYEAMDLRNPKTNEWCAKLIQHGIAATLGAVNEPGLDGFPDPSAFFLIMLTGEYTIAETYWRTCPAVSWQMTLIADPLYNPYKANPLVPAEAIKDIVPPADWAPGYRRPPRQAAP
jgi:uncharacterized protein (TIGR03790 family)